MQRKLENMWASKLGLASYDAELTADLFRLMTETPVDFTIFFRELSHIPEGVNQISRSFYQEGSDSINRQWTQWLEKWRSGLQDLDKTSSQMKKVNPKYTWREWLVAPAYLQAKEGQYQLVHELQELFSNPYDEQSEDTVDKYYKIRPQSFFKAGGISHYSCSS